MRLAGVPLRTEPSRLDLCINALSDTQEASGCCPASGKAQSCELAFVIIPASSHWVKGPAVMDNSKYRGSTSGAYCCSVLLDLPTHDMACQASSLVS